MSLVFKGIAVAHRVLNSAFVAAEFWTAPPTIRRICHRTAKTTYAARAIMTTIMIYSVITGLFIFINFLIFIDSASCFFLTCQIIAEIPKAV